jgi:hypothetical protein
MTTVKRQALKHGGVITAIARGAKTTARERVSFGLRALVLYFAATTFASASKYSDSRPDDPLQGPSGVTALSGQVVDVDGQGLAGVELTVGTSHARSDERGRFLITYVIPGVTVLQIDGRRAGVKRNADHGFYEARVEARAGLTTVLPFKSWLPLIDHAHDVTITSPTRSNVVVRTPSIAGLELRIPPGVVVRDVDDKVVTRVSITAMPADRTPVPLPSDFGISTFYTIQPGAACLYDGKGGIGTATLVLPNFTKELPKARAIMWRYEPDALGWVGFGVGVVSADGTQIVPEPGVVLTDFSSGECDPKSKLRHPPPERVRVRTDQR